MRSCLAAYDVPPEAVQIDKDKRIQLELLDLTFEPDQLANPVIRGYHYAAALKRQCNASFSGGPAEFEVAMNGMRVRVSSPEHLLILHEIHVHGIYSLRIGKPFVLIDVGANVGFTGLYFATGSAAVHVEAFEPCPPAFSQLQHNLGLNPALASRIAPHNLGLFNDDAEMALAINRECLGNSSIVMGKGDGDPAFSEAPVRLRRASAVVEEVSQKWPGRPLVMKLDCEGSEYEILDDLIESRQLARVSAFLIEWHYRPGKPLPGELADRLTGNGFAVHLPGPLFPQARVGMMYAYSIR